jgi:hypothetical protein
MLRRRPPQPKQRAGVSVRPMRRQTGSYQSEPILRVTPVVFPTASVPGAQLARTFYHLRTVEGAICAGQVWQGRCLLLFTSQTAAAAFAYSTGVQTRPPLIFSRSRSEFLAQARRCFGEGFIGGLIDLGGGTGKSEFLGFDVERQQAGPQLA